MAEKMSAPEITLALSSLEHIRIIDLCFRAFMNAREPNSEDGGATDWFNDTLPALQPGIDAFNAHIAALQSEADRLREALEPFARCADELDATEDTPRAPDGEWAKFRLLTDDYRRARAALSATQQDATPVQPAQKTEGA